LFQQVVNIDRSRSLDDWITSVLRRIWREGRQCDAIGLCRYIHERHRGQWIDRPADFKRCNSAYLTSQIHLGRFGRGAPKAFYFSRYLGQPGAIIGPDKIIGVINVTTLQGDTTDLDVGL